MSTCAPKIAPPKSIIFCCGRKQARPIQWGRIHGTLDCKSKETLCHSPYLLDRQGLRGSTFKFHQCQAMGHCYNMALTTGPAERRRQPSFVLSSEATLPAAVASSSTLMFATAILVVGEVLGKTNSKKVSYELWDYMEA